MKVIIAQPKFSQCLLIFIYHNLSFQFFSLPQLTPLEIMTFDYTAITAIPSH